MRARSTFYLPLVWALLFAGGAARAQDPFEIQVYDSETAGPWAPGLELHLNHFFQGTRAASPAGELPTAGVTHLTFEPHLGVTPWAELGLYVQTALRPDGTFDYAGVKFRLKAHAPRLAGDRLGLAANLEFSTLPRTYEAGRNGLELRPIVDFRQGALYASVNPILGVGFGQRPPALSFEPAAKVAWEVGRGVSVGSEYYGSWSDAGAFSLGPGAVHRAFGAVDVVSPYVDVNVGVGRGFGPYESWLVKGILGLHPAPAPAPFTRSKQGSP